MTLCVRSKQPRTIKTIIYNNTFTSIRRKKVQSRVKQFKKLFSLVCYFFALNKPSSALNYLKKNCIYLNQSELSNFFMYLFLRILNYKKVDEMSEKSSKHCFYFLTFSSFYAKIHKHFIFYLTL